MKSMKDILNNSEMTYAEKIRRMVDIKEMAGIRISGASLEGWLKRVMDQYAVFANKEDNEKKLGEYSGRELADFLEKEYNCTVTFHKR